jgi:hypothetical protein
MAPERKLSRGLFIIIFINGAIMISDSLTLRIKNVTEEYESKISELSEASKALDSGKSQYPSEFNKKTDYDSLTLSVAKLKHETNRLLRQTSELIGNLETEIVVLKTQASFDGVYEYYASIEIPKTKVTEQMREAYAFQNEELCKLLKLEAKAKSLNSYLYREVELLITTETNFRRFAERLGGVY